MKIRIGVVLTITCCLAWGAAAHRAFAAPPEPPGLPVVPPAEGPFGEPVSDMGASQDGPRPASPAPPAPPPPASARGAAVAPRGAGGGFLVKFNNADIYEVIHTLGRIAGINYLIDPRVRGVVNVHTQGSVRKEDALELLFSILRINGATAVREGEVYHIVPMAEAKMEPLSPPSPGAATDPSSPNRPVMRAFPLQYIAASEMAKVIKPFLSAGGDATEVSRANLLLVTDTAANMEKHARLVELFDADAFRSAGVRLFPLKFLDPEEMAKGLESIFGALDFTAKGGRPAGINFVPIQRLSSLLVVSASPRTMDDVERWIGELDKEPSSTSRTVHLYRVRHGKAKDIADVLGKLYPGRSQGAGAGKVAEFQAKVGEPAPATSPAAGTPPFQPVTAVAAAAQRPATAPRPAAATDRDKEGQGFDIILDEPNNSLIIRGSTSEYAQILDTLKVLDVYPRQVLLEVLIAEVQLDDAMKLGVDWNFQKSSGSWSHTLSETSALKGLSAATPPVSGFQYLVEKTGRLKAAVTALANDGKVSILSSPSVISTNGKKSRIDVSDSVPIVTGQVTVASSGSPLTTQTVEYKDVGVLLTFTPFINDDGLVTLEIEQEVSEVSQLNVGPSDNPSFFKRSVQTTMLASQDRSIVLGGLVKERKTLSRDGLPFIYKIPVVGWLLGGSRGSQTTRNELLIFITPRVIQSVEEGTQLSREFEERVQELKNRIGEAKMKPEPRKAPEPAGSR